MNKRQLGATGLSVAPLIFGGNVFGWTADEKTSFALLDQFTDAGFDTIDTANSYSSWVPGNQGGESEKIIGRWLSKTGKRDAVKIITKVGWDITPDRKGLDKKSILEEVEISLRNLQTDYIDVYLAHKDDAKTPVEETLAAFDQLIRQGKVRYIGASNFYKDRLLESLEVSRKKQLYEYKVIQPKYNLYDRQFEKQDAGIALEEGLGVITYSSLASGFLSGKYRSEEDFSKSTRGRGMGQYLNEKGTSVLEALQKVSDRHNAAFSTIALAWLLHKPAVTAPIASATNANQLDELMKCAGISLTDEDMDILDKAGE